MASPEAKLPDYQNEEINRLAYVLHYLEQMQPEERYRAFVYFKSKYAKDWPASEPY